MLAFFFVPNAGAVAHKTTETPIAINNDFLRSKSRVFIPCLIHSLQWTWQGFLIVTSNKKSSHASRTSELLIDSLRVSHLPAATRTQPFGFFANQMKNRIIVGRLAVWCFVTAVLTG